MNTFVSILLFPILFLAIAACTIQATILVEPLPTETPTLEVIPVVEPTHTVTPTVTVDYPLITVEPPSDNGERGG